MHRGCHLPVPVKAAAICGRCNTQPSLRVGRFRHRRFEGIALPRLKQCMLELAVGPHVGPESVLGLQAMVCAMSRGCFGKHIISHISMLRQVGAMHGK